MPLETIANLVAKAPFDDPSLADLVLRSSDNTDFFVFRGILMFTSPIFRNMVAVSDAGNDSELPKDELIRDGLRVVVMHESSAPVLDALLRFLHPMKSPVLDDFAIISGIVSAAKKYEMEHVFDGVKKTLHDLSLDGDPKHAMGAYLVASSMEWEDLARAFAIETLRYSLDLDETRCSFIFMDTNTFVDNIWRLLSFRIRAEDRIVNPLFGSALSLSGENNDFFLRVQDINLCPDNCVKDKKTNVESWIWLQWRSLILAKLHRAPLAHDLVIAKDLRDLASRSNCYACIRKVPGISDAIVLEFKREMLRLAQAELF